MQKTKQAENMSKFNMVELVYEQHKWNKNKTNKKHFKV